MNLPGVAIARQGCRRVPRVLSGEAQHQCHRQGPDVGLPSIVLLPLKDLRRHVSAPRENVVKKLNYAGDRLLTTAHIRLDTFCRA